MNKIRYMKKFILLFSLIFCAFYGNVNAQVIDSVVISQIIECPGDKGEITVYATPVLGNYSIVLQDMNAAGAFDSHKQGQWDLNGQTTVHTFTNLNSNFYRILLVDPNCSPPYSNMLNIPANDTCIYTFATIFLPNAVPLTYDVVPASLDCWYDTTADLTVNNILGYTPPYTLTLLDATGNVISGPTNLGGGLPYTFTNLPAGNYQVSITDTFNCSAVIVSEEITANDTILPGGSVIDSISCYNADDGQIEATATGGTPPYTWSWVGPNGYTATTQTISNLGPGSYTCTITDSLLCDTITETFTLIEPLMLAGVSAITQTINCFDSCNGEITVTLDPSAPGAGPLYTYTITNLNTGITSPPTGATVFPGLCSDNATGTTDYQITIFDTVGCDTVLTPLTLTQPDELTFDIDSLSYVGNFGVSCKDSCDGEITISNIQGGNLPPYGFSSSYMGGVIFNPDTIFSDICGDSTYSFIVTDSLGCIGQGSIDINEPEQFVIDATLAPLLPNGFHVSCPFVCDGDVFATNSTPLPTGNGNIDYWLNGTLIGSQLNTSTLPITLPGACGENTFGQNIVQAVDENGCIAFDSILLTEPQPFTIDLDSINQNCGTLSGQVSVQVQGGVPPLTYNWTGPAGFTPVTNGPTALTVDTIKQLFYGYYTCQVVDALGCFAILDSILVDSANIEVTPTVYRACNDSAAMIVLTFNPIAPVNSVVWALESSLQTIIDSTVDWNSSSIFTDTLFPALGDTTYWYQVQRTGCNPFPADSIYVGPDLTMTATLDPASITNLPCFDTTSSAILINVNDNFNSAGASNSFWNSYKYSILEDPTYAPTAGNGGPTPHNLFALGGSIGAGTYNVIVVPSDSINPVWQNCIDTVQVTISQPDSLEFTLGYTETICYGDSTGSVYVSNISGGNTGPYNYTWTNSLGNIIGNTDSLTGLPAGWYTLSVTDNSNCPASYTPPVATTIDSIEITQPTEVIMTLTVVSIDSCGAGNNSNSIGEFHINTTGGTPYWNGYDMITTGTVTGNPLNLSYQIGSFASIATLDSGWYLVEVQDSLGCKKTDSVEIEQGQNPQLDFNATFTNVSCKGWSDGSYIAVVDSVSGSLSFPYTFWNPQTNTWDPAFTPQDSLLSAGDSISIRIKDDFGCVDSIGHIVTEPDSLIIQRLTPLVYPGDSNISCFGYLDGAIDIDSVTGGTLPYYYSINGFYNPDSTDHYFDTLAAAWYYADVIDANGCTYRDSITLSQPDSLVIDSFTLSTYIGGWGVSCFGFDDGFALGHPSGGTYDGSTFTYTYAWTSITDTLLNDSLVSADTLSANHWYVLHITDTNDCFAIDSIILTEPTPLVIDSFDINHVLCVGGDRGNATVFVSGGTTGYSFLWDNEDLTSPTYVNPNDTVGSHNDTTALADTLRAGDYIVQIHDTNGCYITDTITITEPSISVEIDSLVVTQMTCYSYNNASVDIVATGPEPLPYYYTVYEALNPSNIASQGNLGFNQGLGPGDYVAQVTDGIGCIDRDTFNIAIIDSVYIIDVQWENLSCYGFDDGYVTNINATGGTPPYEYAVDLSPEYPSWLCNQNPNNCPTGYVFTGLAPGDHFVHVIDSNECKNSYKITVTEPLPMNFGITTNSYNNYQIPCFGDLDSAFVWVNGGGPDYTFYVNNTPHPTDSMSSGTYIWSDIPAGTHTFSIKDSNNCVVDTIITFISPDQMTANNSFVTEVLCQDSCTGAITAIIDGGLGQGVGTSYLYQWYSGAGLTNPISGENSYIIDSLCIDPQDTYTIHVTDGNLCEESFTWSIDSNVLFLDSVATAFGIVNPSCYNSNDGSITAIINGGSTPYHVTWSDDMGQIGNPAIALSAGVYTCTVVDGNGCIVEEDFLLEQPDSLIAIITEINPVSCYGDSDGELKVTVTGGTPGFDYIWSTNETTSTISGLSPGQYTVQITDDHGCETDAMYELANPTKLVFANWSTTEVLCHGDATGSITAQAADGTPFPGFPNTYKYNIVAVSGTSTPPDVQDDIAIFNGLDAGIYRVEVIDYRGCDTITGDIYISQPSNPLSILVEGFDGSCDNPNSSVMVNAQDGTPGYFYDWSLNPNDIANGAGIANEASAMTNVTPLSYGYTWYYIEVTDNNGCSIEDSISVKGYGNIFGSELNSAIDTVFVCSGGTIQIDINQDATSSYHWVFNGDTVSYTTSLTTDSSWSQYEVLTLLIIDINGCGWHKDINVVIEDVEAACSISDNNVLIGSSVTLSARNVFNQYIWTNKIGDTISLDREVIVDNLQESDCFMVYVEDDNGCNDYCERCVTVGSKPFNAFSPNGDGHNEYWVIEDIEKFINPSVQIYNRWGELIFDESPTTDQCWDGTIDGKDAPVGTYYYIIDQNDGSELLKGSITLVR